MKYLNFGSWFIFTVTALLVAGSSVHTFFNHLAPAIGLTGNRATAGGYTMEVVTSVIAFVMVLWRLIWAIETTHSIKGAAQLLKTRTAILSIGIAGLIGMGFTNRFFWWLQHMFTKDAFDYTDVYAGTSNSVIVSALMCIVVYALHAEPREPTPMDAELPIQKETFLPRGTIIAVSIWLVGIISFVIGCLLYPGRG